MPPPSSTRDSSVAILLPPSEGKASDGGRPNWKVSMGTFGRELARARSHVVHALAEIDGGTAAMLGVSGLHLERARRINSHLVGSSTLPAWCRYTGVVWDHIDPGSLSTAAMDRARRSIVVVSGLLGLVGFDDPIPDYKLKISAALDLPETSGTVTRQRLAAYWQPRMSPVLNEWLAGRTVIDLLPLEHRRAWQPSPDLRLLRATFVDGRGRRAGHDAKAAKGSFVRHVLTARSPARALETWSHPEYRVDLSDSDASDGG